MKTARGAAALEMILRINIYASSVAREKVIELKLSRPAEYQCRRVQ